MIHAALLLVALAMPGQDPPLANWRELDLEQRWLALDAMARDPDWSGAQSWAQFLVEQREFELLEWLALYPPREGLCATFADALRNADAPQWARVELWTMRNRDSHTSFAPRKVFVGERPGFALDWLERHASELDEKGAGVLAELRALSPQPAREDSSRALAPWTAAALIPHLASAGPIEVLAAGARAAQGHVYVHQIERELRLVAAAQLYAEPVRAQLRALTQNASAEVRAFAWLAVAEATLQALPPAEWTDSSFARVVDDPREDGRVRSAALLALSQRADRDPRAWFALHAIARDPSHPAWNSAVSRLGEVGDEFTRELLEGLATRWTREAQAAQSELASRQIKRLRERADPTLAFGLAGTDPASLLERTAWADVANDPLETARSEWTVRYFSVRRAPSEFRTAIETLAQDYSVPPAGAGADDAGVPLLAPFAPRVREWAARLLAIK